MSRVKKGDRIIGQEFVCRGGVSLVAIRYNGKVGNDSRHDFFCDVCSRDEEMLDGGIFTARTCDVTHSMASPCRCNSHPKWTEWQYIVRCKRSCIAKGLRFIGWKGQYSGHKTNVLYRCPRHGLASCSINNLLNSGQGCRKCYEDSIRARAQSDEDAAENYLSRCGYPDGTTISRVGPPDGDAGTRSLFRLWCPACSCDEFSQAGIADGNFVVTIESLCSGHKSCRCGKTRRKTEEIARYQCESVLASDGFEFDGWCGEYRNGKSRINAVCKTHGAWTPQVYSVLAGRRCPDCSKGGYSTSKPGTLYLLGSECGKMMKIGITNSLQSRIKYLVAHTPFQIYSIATREMDGAAAPVLERKILEESNRLGLSGFNGATEWIEWDQRVMRHFT